MTTDCARCGGRRALFAPAVGVTQTKEAIMTNAAQIPTAPRDAIIHGDCIEIMQTLPARSVDFILTDPIWPHTRVATARPSSTTTTPGGSLAHSRRCTAFSGTTPPRSASYGWPKTDLFFGAWKWAGFRIGGHIVFRKRYASKTAFLQYRHEAASLLVKGIPAFPCPPQKLSPRKTALPVTFCDVQS